MSKPAPRAVGGSRPDSNQSVQTDKKPIQKVSASPNNDVSINSNAKTGNNDNLTVSNQLIDKNHNLDPYNDILKNAFITGSVFSLREANYSFSSDIQGSEFSFNSIDLRDVGYRVKWVKPCKAKIFFEGKSSYIYCSYKNSIHETLADNQQAAERVPTGTQRKAS